MDRTQRAADWAFQNLTGFVTAPDDAQCARYGRALIACAGADGTLHEAERDWILGYLAALGASQSVLDDLAGYTGDPHVVTDWFGDGGAPDPKAARALIFDAFCACTADHDLHPEEQAAIFGVGEALGLTRDEVMLVQSAWNLHVSAQENRAAVLFPR